MAARKAKRSRARAKGRKVANPKLQRWIDLLAALLNRYYGATAAELRDEVPGYAATKDPRALERMFERDKDELRAFGIPIEVKPARDGEAERYVVDPREMYLPYLELTSAARNGAGRRMKAGLRALPSLSFEPDELSALVAAADVAERLGDPVLSGDVASGMRKLTFDLPIGSAIADDAAPSPVVDHDTDGPRLRALGGALLRRKRVSFTYRTIGNDATARRTVEPYGLFFLSGHWYLAARDAEKGDIRNFRVSRMSKLSANTRTLQKPDYAIPRGFRLAEHARSRAPWEIGSDGAQEMVLEFRGSSGAVQAAVRLGRPVAGSPRRRAFDVRRLDAFVRWSLSFAGEAVPVSPPRLIDAYRDAVQKTLRHYGGGAP